MKIKQNDQVKIMAGKDAGKTGKVTQVIPEDNQVVVDGLNIMVKHVRAPKQGEKGQRLEFNAPLNAAKVQLICPKCNKVTRVAYQILEDGKKQRRCTKCKETI